MNGDSNRAPRMVLVAHGTRSARGVDMISSLADAVREQVDDVRVAFVDVLGPSPADLLRNDSRPTVLVPAFLASGYHVHSDVPREVAESGHGSVTVTPALGPDPLLARAMHRRLSECGWQPGDSVVLAAAGSSDKRALRDVRRAGRLLADRVGGRVEIGYVATGQPRVPDVVMRAKQDGRRVFVASYLLAHGLFQERLLESGADGVTAPLGCHPSVVELLVERFRVGARSLDALRVA